MPDISRFNTPNFQTLGTANLSSLANPYGGYCNPYLSTEPGIAATLRGTADITSAQGKWFNDVQRANMLQEKYRQASIETVRTQDEENRWEKDNAPTAEDDRHRALQQQLSRSLNDPPRGDIYSGQALNVLLDAASKLNPRVSTAPASIDRGVLAHLNLTSGKGHAGIFRNQGRLDWPQELLASTYQDERKLLDASMPIALRQTAKGTLDARMLEDLNRRARALRQKLHARIAEVAPT